MSSNTTILSGKKVIVIGGSSGIGRSVAAATLSHGASVVIASSSQDKVNIALGRLKQGVPPQSNVTVTGQVITGGDRPANVNFPEQDIDLASSQSFFDYLNSTRYWSTIIAAQHIHKNKLINPGGSITLTIGTSVYRPIPGWGLVSGLAGAVESSTRGLAIDLKPIREDHPVGHIGKPEELAEAYLFAMKCTYLTGQVLVVDGGASIA
ncbi:unnamed protein product [Rhizoctonia solani]|uniref:Uncharacterized protein n=1 Tax=Rhizoctonia solani TaxID=456999 RepID=A0A8H2ZXY8_9AGAM|nr:unnamed protein product [Rhizoctonia solani]